MNQCSKCNTEVPKGAKFCSNCGNKIVEKSGGAFCENCGAGLKPEAKFCHACGHTVGSAVAAANNHDEGVGEFEAQSGSASPQRSWTAILLPLLGMPALIGILFLLTYKQDNPKPMSQAQMSGAAPPEAGEQGMDMAAMENVRKQIDQYKSALQANPQDTTALLALGGMYEIAGRFDEAADYFQRYLKISPENVPVRMSLAGIYYNHAQHESADPQHQGSFRQKALNELQQVLKYKPNYDYAMFNLGVINLAKGKKEEAVQWWQKVADAAPNGELAQKAREQIQAAGGK